MKADVVDLGCKPEKIIVHYGGVDVNRVQEKRAGWGKSKDFDVWKICGKEGF
ncbi:unnamed protein product [marine sediment metagenome]|uniref:Uncharacterized protein n=1 Tax=marine sediment metagenome TaxID=412755 RepID=X1DG02_9ZZZZ